MNKSKTVQKSFTAQQKAKAKVGKKFPFQRSKHFHFHFLLHSRFLLHYLPDTPTVPTHVQQQLND